MPDKSEEGQHEIICEEVMDISTVAGIKLQLVEALESGLPVMLDAKQVERADTAALQVLSAFFQEASAKKQDIQWRDPSDALSRSSALLGLSELLQLEDTLH